MGDHAVKIVWYGKLLVTMTKIEDALACHVA
jgi:hypothetical protein